MSATLNAGWQSLRDKTKYTTLMPEIIINDEEQLRIIKLPTKLRGTYVIWRFGVNPYFTMARETYYRHKTELMHFGIDIGAAYPRGIQTK